ncbi:MAG TPA: hypothetical protein VKA37_04660 [Halobacteriales archaeon]|nr:hypothetical protein [Halobacteriales archaeon]
MTKLTRAIGSLVVGGIAFVVVGVGVTEGLAPYIWPSAMLGLPAGLVAGVATVAMAYLGLTYRAERAEAGRASTRTVARFWATAAAILAFVLAGGAAMLVLAAGAVGLATAMLLGGLPIGIVAALVAGYVVDRRVRVRHPPRGPTPQ